MNLNKLLTNSLSLLLAFIVFVRATKSIIDHGCGGTVTGSSGSIMSPNYPQAYPANANCEWLIKVSEGSTISLTIVAIDIEQHDTCQYDYLQLFDGDSENSKSLLKICNNQQNPGIVQSKGNTMLVRFRSDFSEQAGGFHLVYHSDAVQRMRREASDDSDSLSRIRNLLLEARSETGDVDFNGLLSENIYDPVPLAAFNISTDGFITKLSGQFTDLNLHGLKGFRVDRVAMNMAKMNLSADMSVPMLNIIGQYFLDGTVTFFAVSGDGPFWMNMTGIKLKGHSLIGTTPEGRLSMGDINLDSEVGDIALHFENLMGGGAWGSISNSLLNQLSELILGELKPSLLRELSSYLKHQFDDVLFQQLPDGFMSPSSKNLVDSLLEKASRYMVENEIEPLRLREYEEIYESNLLVMTTRGEFKLYNGTLQGLTTIARKGDVMTVFENNSLIFEADFEFENLTGSYTWAAEVFGSRTTGNMEIQVKSVEGFIKLRQDMKAGSKLELDTLHVKQIRHIWLDLHGLGRWDYIMESILNLVTNGLKLQLADAIAEPVKKGVQEQLDLLKIRVPENE